VVQIPGVDNALTRFLDPTFADSTIARHEPSNGSAWLGLVIGAAISLAGIAIAYRIWVLAPATATSVRERLAPVHKFLVNKWYFDELIDLVIVRPALWLGRVAESVFERSIVQGFLTGGTVAIVRASSAAVRRTQTGFLRYYAAAVIVGVTGTALYFLVSSS
jgi:NADH-quinone oxidoreductase subunit L